MSQTSETQLTEAPAPWAQKPRDRRALSAYRHGLTGQIILLTDADRAAYEKHCQGYHQSLRPEALSKSTWFRPWPMTAGA
jgi:hypothetical protein